MSGEELAEQKYPRTFSFQGARTDDMLAAVKREAFIAGYDAREQEITGLKEALEVYATKCGKEAIAYDALQSQLEASAAREKKLREALEDAKAGFTTLYDRFICEDFIASGISQRIRRIERALAEASAPNDERSGG